MKQRLNIKVLVGDNNNIEKAIRRLKKMMEREGIVRDIKRSVYFESPTQKRRKRLMRAIKQNLLREVAQGLIR